MNNSNKKKKMNNNNKNKKIACPKCNNDFIGQTTFLVNGFQWFTCYECNYKSNNKEDFIK